MTKSTTWIVRLSKVRRRKAFAHVLTRLMMALNDITLAEDALSQWNDVSEGSRLSRRVGAKMYFMRAQLAHLHEAMLIVEQINKHFCDAVEGCDERTRESFALLREFLKSDDYKRITKAMRHRVTFHYDQNEVEKALAELEQKRGDFETKYSLGTEVHLWYFELADRVVDWIVVRRIWNIPEGTDVRSAADEIAVRLQGPVKSFVDFAGHFLRHHLKT